MILDEIIKELKQEQIIVVNDKMYKLEKPVFKSIDKNGFCTIYGFKEVTDGTESGKTV